MASMFPRLIEEKGDCPSPVMFTQPMEPFLMLDDGDIKSVLPEPLERVVMYPNVLVVGDYSFSHSTIQVSKYTEYELVIEYPDYIVTVKCPRERDSNYYHFTKIARLVHYERTGSPTYILYPSVPGCGGKVAKKA